MTTERVGRYQLLEPIGVGPTGSVSRAKVFGVAGFERQFAVKRFHTELTSAAAQAQALSSAARAYGGLEHPRIARMSEFGVAQGTTYTAVEYVPGLDALRLVNEVKLSNATLAAGGALALVSQAARAIGYAHGRGLTHLGLSPTNVVVTPEGDVKITDFGILAATLPPKPLDVARLAHRLPYLAPEQLANEATSAATDVFALGVLAYELVTGQRAFKGETPQQIAKAVMGGPPAEPPLPRPIVRVLARCLARSPFERFPDARALADALDAALRVAPVPGTRKDVGSHVKQITDRLAELHSGELSGMLSVVPNPGNLGAAGQVAALGNAPPARDSQVELATLEFVRPDTPVAGPAPLKGPTARPTRAPGDPLDDDQDASSTLVTKPAAPAQIPSKIAIPPHTVPGLAPPPIPSTPIPAPKFSHGAPPVIPPNIPALPGTLMGVGNKPKPLVGAVPPPKPGQGPTRPVAVEPPERPSESPVSPLKMMSTAPSGTAPAVPIARTIPIPPKLDAKKQVFGALHGEDDAPDAPRTDLVIETDPGDASTLDALLATPDAALLQALESSPRPAARPATPPPRAPTPPPVPSGSLSVEMTIVHPEDEVTRPGDVVEIAARQHVPTDEISPILADKLAEASVKPTTEIPPLVTEEFPDEAAPGEVPAAHTKTLLGGGFASAGVKPPPTASFSQQVERNAETMDVRALPPPNTKRKSKAPWIVVSVLGVAALGAGGYVGYDMLTSDDGGTKVAAVDAATKAADAGKVVTDAATPADAAVVVKSPDDAATAVDAATVAEPVKPDPPTDTLTITSTPSGARVWVNGSDKGPTPVKLPGTPDKYNIAVHLAGHELYLAQGIAGSGSHAVKLKEITPLGGPAGIKVIQCKNKEQYYVYVDGKPTGMTCPTERIQVQLGEHTIEVYDMVSEAKRSFPVLVKDTRLSVRVKVE